MTIARAAISIVGGLVCGAVFWPAVDNRGTPVRSCMSNLKQLALTNIMYAADYDDHFPDRDRWVDVVWPYAKNPRIFRCPEIAPQGEGVRYGYAFNADLSWKAIPVAADVAPLVYDSINEARNASDPFTSLPKPGRHNGRDTVAYADAHAKSIEVK